MLVYFIQMIMSLVIDDDFLADLLVITDVLFESPGTYQSCVTAVFLGDCCSRKNVCPNVSDSLARIQLYRHVWLHMKENITAA
jgi:hypothetical protein